MIQLNTTWLLYYGRKLGMTEQDTLACPLGRMLDYMACMQIENGANQRVHADLDALADIE